MFLWEEKAAAFSNSANYGKIIFHMNAYCNNILLNAPQKAMPEPIEVPEIMEDNK